MQASQPHAPPTAPDPVRSGDVAGIHPLDALRRLHSAGDALFSQAALHARLAGVEWALEKSRLWNLLIAVLLGYACLLCLAILLGAVTLALAWGTPYQIPAIIILVAASAGGTRLAWQRVQSLAAQSAQSFIATREALSADLALLRGLS